MCDLVRTCPLAHSAFSRKFANPVKSGCVNRKAKTMTGPISRRAAFFKNSPLQKTGIRKSKTGRWRAAALILLNLFMIAHIIQWQIMGKTISPIEPSETMHTLEKGFVNAGFIFFTLQDPFAFVLALLALGAGRFQCQSG